MGHRPVRYRRFANTDWEVSEIGIGMMPLSGMYSPIDNNDAVRTLLYAIERGVNFIDAALMYGAGRSHHQIRTALQQDAGNHTVYVATKAEPITWPSTDDHDPDINQLYPAGYLTNEVDRALDQLGLERIDLFQLHCWVPSGTTSRAWLEELHSLQAAGKIDQIGVSMRDHRPEDGIDLAQQGHVASQQVVFNLFDQRPAEKLFRVGETTGTAFIARVPFDSGSLIGNWNPETYQQFEPGTIRHDYFRGWRFDETLRRVEQLKELVAPFYPTLAEAALRYSLSDPAVTSVIPGMANSTEIDLNVAYSDDSTFAPELATALSDHAWPRNFYAPDPI